MLPHPLKFPVQIRRVCNRPEHFIMTLRMEGVGENFGSTRTEETPPPRFSSSDHEPTAVDMHCVGTGHCAEAYQHASDHLRDAASSNLPDVQLAVPHGEADQFFAGDHDFELELKRQLAQKAHASISTPEFMSGVESENAADAALRPPRPALPPSEAIGITYHKKNKQWEAHLWVKDRQLGKRKKKGAQVFLGTFKTRDEAKAAHDKAAIKLDVRETANGKPYPLNFPESAQAQYLQEHADWSSRDFVWKIRRFSHKFSKGKSGMKGVSVRTGKGRAASYEAKISHTMGGGAKRTFGLGMFGCEADAGRAYDRALLFLKGGESDCVTNFRPSGYSVAEIQEVGRGLLGTDL